jgi:hypothetical protein
VLYMVFCYYSFITFVVKFHSNSIVMQTESYVVLRSNVVTYCSVLIYWFVFRNTTKNFQNSKMSLERMLIIITIIIIIIASCCALLNLLFIF